MEMEIKDGSFAEACINTNSIEELEQALDGPPDTIDMKAWNLTADEWREQIQLAIDYLKNLEE